MAMKIRPLGDRVLVEPKEVKEEIQTGMLPFDKTEKEPVYQNVKVQWSEDAFGTKLERAAANLKSDVRALILSACVESVKILTGRSNLSVMLEGHGREKIHKEANIEHLSGSIEDVAIKLLPTLKQTDVVVGLGAGTITNLGKYLKEHYFASRV